MDKPRLLVVDDTPANIKVLNDLLREDYVIAVATSGPRALELAWGEEPPDLVLLDVMMPDMDGYEVCRRLKADPRTRDVPVIFVTAMAETEDETRGFELGAMDYIAKPVSPPIVQSRVRSAIALRRKTREMEALSRKLARYLSPQVYQSIFEGSTEARIESRRKRLTVFFSDIVGFTTATERMEAEAMSALLNAYLEAMSGIVHKHGGTIDKFMGDAIMAFFGDPASRGEKEDALACTAMALDMREALKDLRKEWFRQGVETPFSVRIGINTGFCTVGNFGSAERMEYTIIGAPVNLASRLQTAAEPDQVLVSHETWSLIRDRFYCIKRKPLALKGIPYPVPTYQVVDTYERMPGDHSVFSLGSLAEEALVAPHDAPAGEVRRMLGDDPMACAVVARIRTPAGLVRNLDLMLLEAGGGEAAALSLPVGELMDPDPLMLEAAIPLAEAARLATQRREGRAGDPLVVTQAGLLAGLVAVPALLGRLAELHEESADAGRGPAGKTP
ncbi:MAG: adenylate/guanylate cyclase domain-containing protein [Thermodesulfobacteriota bacterium]